MEIIWTFFLFALGLIMTIKGGDWFVDASIWIAERTGISSGIIAATIVSIATTLPEFFVSTVASNEGFSEMAVGNALGSYTCNIAFVIGLCAIIKPIEIKDSFFGIKGIMMLINLFIFFVFSKDGIINEKEGFILLSLIIPFIIINIFEYKQRNKSKSKKKKGFINKKDIVFNGIKFIMGGAFIIYGAHILVGTGVEIANILRIPKQVVSLTLLAIGTSLPELVTSLMAIFKNQQSISIGNILGANILNLSIIMGASQLVSEHGLRISYQTIFLDIPIAILVGLIFVSAGLIKEEINRLLGIVFLGIYIIYLLILF
ncbi:MAG: calcium/sodium antiporter [Tissierellia bacterium]|nr:calcium/sodium antiporter [Tissierellia bacterium]